MRGPKDAAGGHAVPVAAGRGRCPALSVGRGPRWLGIIVFAFILTFLACRFSPLLSAPEFAALDLLISMRPARPPDFRIALIGISESDSELCRRSRPDDCACGAICRDRVGDVITRLKMSGAAVVAVDLMVDRPCPVGASTPKGHDAMLAAARADWRPSAGRAIVGGVAVSGEPRQASGIYVAPGPEEVVSAVTRTPFRDEESRHGATFYLDATTRLGDRDRLLVGGRLAAREGMRPVLRPRVALVHALHKHSTLVLLTRPILRDDVSELAPADYWSLRDALTPLDLGLGAHRVIRGAEPAGGPAA